MAFRDEREQLRQRIRELRDEVATRTGWRDAAHESLLAERNEIDVEAKAGTRFPFAPLGIAVLVLGAVMLAMFVSGSSDRSETMFGRVVLATGSPPVAEGSRCTVFTSGGGDDWDAQFYVLCGGRSIYGDSDSGGYLDCPQMDDRLMKCRDENFSDTGGDPRLDFDRRRGAIVVDERSPDWRIEIQLYGLRGGP